MHYYGTYKTPPYATGLEHCHTYEIPLLSLCNIQTYHPHITMPDMTSPLTHPQSKPTPHILKNIDGTVFKNIAGYIMLQEL